MMFKMDFRIDILPKIKADEAHFPQWGNGLHVKAKQLE